MNRLLLGIIAIALLLDAAASCQDRGPSPSGRRTAVVTAVEKVSRSVVSVNTQSAVQRRRTPWDELFGYDSADQNGTGTVFRDVGLGSGVIVDAKGYLITNDHVIGGASRLIVTLWDGTQVPARLVGDDTDNDIAVLKLLGDGPYEAATLATSDDLLIGEPTIVMGCPFGLQGSVTTGVLSATKRPITFRGREVFSDFIQTSAVINPGNSGGPLLNIDGDVIGINVAIHSRGPGIGFAIPVARVREVIYRALDPRIAKRAWLGLEVEHKSETPGATVTLVDADGPAADADIDVGDVILAVDGRAIINWIDFQTTLDGVAIGADLTLNIQRAGKKIVRRVTLTVAPQTPAERAVFDMVGFEFDDLSDEQRRASGLNGIVVRGVRADSSAARSGVEVGDIVFSLGGYNVRDKTAALAIIQGIATRRTALDIRLVRNAQRFRGTIELTTR